MPIIKAGAGVITQINVFTVPEGGQQALIELLQEAAASCKATVPGWLSASLHRCLDGRRVVNYAQAEDQQAMRRVFEHLQANGFLDRNKALGEAQPGLYEVTWTIER